MFSPKNLPSQQLSYRAKNKAWRKQHLQWAESKTYFHDSTVRKSLFRKKINQNLLNGYLDMNDLSLVLNPNNIVSTYIPENIQHYPIINSKLNILRGEEWKRRFDFRIVRTNPNSINEIQLAKKNELITVIQELIESKGLEDEEFDKELQKYDYVFNYEWQDILERDSNYLMKHYFNELNFRQKFNAGFMDAMAFGEEIYQCDIRGGEPTFEKLNPMKVVCYRNGYSNKIEDSDMIILVDFWSPGKIIETFYDVLSQKDIKYIENIPVAQASDSMENTREVDSFIRVDNLFGDLYGSDSISDNFLFTGFSGLSALSNYYDTNGNIRVLRFYWKSKRLVKKIKRYNMETGEEEFDFYSEDYIPNITLGEEETKLWINEAWEATLVGKDCYLNMRPRIVQYNRLSNPSRCHFGITGVVYNFNDSKPFSMVDIMKPYSYLYDVLHHRLNEAIAANWGKIMKLDLSLVPKGWDIQKWLYYAKTNKLAVVDSFKEGNIGASKGKLAGLMNNQSSGVIDAETGSYIQQHIELLEYVKGEMSEAVGISKQREGQISSNETVGGVERATLQSSHITEWLFMLHDVAKKTAIECFIETAKAALKGKSKKFQHILSDGFIKYIELDGDNFANSDYGCIVDNSPETQRLAEKLDLLAERALATNNIRMSAIMKMYSSASIAEIQRLVEQSETEQLQSQNQAAENELAAKNEEVQAKLQLEQAKMELENEMNMRDNETRLLIAEAQSNNTESLDNSSTAINDLNEKIRQFNEKMRLEREKLEFDKTSKREELRLKEKAINKPKPSK